MTEPDKKNGPDNQLRDGAAERNDPRNLAQGIIRQNLVNLAKKLKDGKTLTPSEMAMVQEAIGNANDAPESPRWAKNQVELANALGVDRKTVQRWLKETSHPGTRTDGRYSIAEWQSWAETSGKRMGESDESIVALKAQQIGLQNRKLAEQLRVLMREHVAVSDVETIGARLGASIRKVVTSLHLLAPSMAGMGVPEIETLLRDKEDEIMGQLHVLHAGISDLKQVDAEAAMEIEEQAEPAEAPAS